MKDADQAIEKVLGGFRATDPPAGMEVRILGHLRAHARSEERTESRLSWLWLFVSRPAVGIAVAVCLVLGFVLSILSMKQSTYTRAVVTATSERANAQAGESASATKVARFDGASERVNAATRRARRQKEPGILNENANTPPKAMEAINYPAPPMPLTEQEKLLLRLAHRQNSKNLAVLNPVNEAKQEAIEVAQFEDFFKNQKIEVKSAPSEQR